jgi:hypothetical protein
MIIDFGDGTTATMGTLPEASGPEKGVKSFTIKHPYATAGHYTVRVIGRVSGNSCVSRPIKDTAEVTVVKAQTSSGKTQTSPGKTQTSPGKAPTAAGKAPTAAGTAQTAVTAAKLLTLPSGVVGLAYREVLKVKRCKQAGAFSVVNNHRLPPGLKVGDKGKVIGTPTRKGGYDFTVRMKCGDGSTLHQPCRLKVGLAALTVEATPGVLNIARTAGRKRVVYDLRTSAPVNTRVVSDAGVFFALPGGTTAKTNKPSGQPLGQYVKTLTAQLVNGKADKVSESIQIPDTVLKKARQLGTNRLLYQRIFASAATTEAAANLQVNYTSAATADLTLTRMRIYFENQRPKITFKRNQKRDSNVAVEIGFVGSGKLTGRWEYLMVGHTVGIQAEGSPGNWRVLRRVTKLLTSNSGSGFRSITLRLDPYRIKTHLPTFTPGTHRVRFVVEQPKQQIDFPQGVYFVTAEEAPVRYAILLSAPDNHSEWALAPVTFRWHGSDKMVRYKIEIMGRDTDNPIFKTYTRATTYELPLKLINDYFSIGDFYSWKVSGFGEGNQLIGESESRSFLFKALPNFVQRQILLIFEQNYQNSTEAAALELKHGLTLMNTYTLESVNLTVVRYQTDQDVMDTVSKLVTEPGVLSAQPNYIFQTLAEPMSDMQGLFRILNLEAVHLANRGRNVTVAVVDTGVDVDHEDLKERVVDFESYFDDGAYMAEVHGTAVAGIIGASLNDFGIAGIAPEASLFAARACRQLKKDMPAGECYSTSLAQALDAAIIKKVDIVNLSLGSPVVDPLLERLFSVGAQSGILFTAPVGNGQDQTQIAFPASDSNVIAVAGTDAKGNPVPNAIVGARAEVRAPAAGIFTTVPGNQHNFLNGTSLSTAVVSGILAVAQVKRGLLKRSELPRYEGDLCRWQEQLLGTLLCDPPEEAVGKLSNQTM